MECPWNAPMEHAARVAFQTILEQLDGLSSGERIRFVLFDEADRELHDRVFQQVTEPNG